MRVYLLVIAAHQSEPTQFALGLTNGGVCVLETLESDGQWGTAPPTENGARTSALSVVAGEDQEKDDHLRNMDSFVKGKELVSRPSAIVPKEHQVRVFVEQSS
ncbi:hypothetical protein Droror1_Dr00026614 [Drosera rotundifolia]